MDIKVEIFQALKSLEMIKNSKVCESLQKILENYEADVENIAFSLRWLILNHAFVTLLSLYIADILWSQFQYRIDPSL